MLWWITVNTWKDRGDGDPCRCKDEGESREMFRGERLMHAPVRKSRRKGHVN